MKMCKFCGQEFQWGRTPDGWVPLIPLSRDARGLKLDYQDSDGNLRASHHQVCTSKFEPAVSVIKLPQPVRIPMYEDNETTGYQG